MPIIGGGDPWRNAPRISHLWFCIDYLSPDELGALAQPTTPEARCFFGELQASLRRLDKSAFHDFERFEIEWDTNQPSEGPMAHGWWFGPEVQVVKSYGYLVGKKENGVWHVRYFDRRGRGRYHWLSRTVDGVEAVHEHSSTDIDLVYFMDNNVSVDRHYD